MNRKDFNLVDKVIYFDNSATTLKPKSVIDKVCEYYTDYSSNIHRGDYNISMKAEEEFDNTRLLVSKLINCNINEVVFTRGTTESLNMVVSGFFKNILKENDEIIISKAEHASNMLPWFELAKELKLKIKFVELDNKHVTLDNIKKLVTDKTKVISLAQVTNVLGDIRPIKEIAKYAHSKKIYMVCDGAQAVPHLNVDVKDLDIDFYAFSAHKMCGPTGVGVLYGKYELLDQIKPTNYGGDMNSTYTTLMEVEYKSVPTRLEGGTPNIAGIIAFSESIKYLNKIGLDNIRKHELELKKYAINKLKKLKDIIIYNDNCDTGIITINHKDIFAQDLAIYLNKYNICVRAGNHCAKVLKEEIETKNTVRISLYFYNTKEEIDVLVNALSNPNIRDEII